MSRDWVSCPYKTTGKIIVYFNLYVLDGQQDDKRFGAEW
jgi:hypothetical protein